MIDSLAGKEEALKGRLRHFAYAAVAFSGGVDSSYLLAVAVETLGAERVLALTADSALVPRHEMETAQRIAALMGAPHRIVPIDVMANADVVANPPERCYHCKRAVFSALQEEARRQGIEVLLHGANRDDLADFRPGQRAADELGVCAPLHDAGLTKAEIRELSRRRGLPTWDMPAMACLATRIPYDTPLTPERLRQVEQAEDFLRQALGLRSLRVRHHGAIARIELPPADWPAVLEEEARTRIVEAFRTIGFTFVTLDLAGQQGGSMNAMLQSDNPPPSSS